MSVTLLCLVKGNTLANAFPVHIDGDSLVGDLKDAIKAKKAPEFDYFSADKLKLWKVSIPGDHLDDQLKNLTLKDSDELSAIKKISKYFLDTPAEEHIHVLVEPPVLATASTATSDREQKLLDELTTLRALLNKSVHVFDVVVSPKRTRGSKWTVNIEHATLNGFKEYIRKMHSTTALDNDGAELNMLNDSGKFSPRNDQDFREMLQVFVSENIFKFSVFIETPSKPFNEWTFPKVCELYGISTDPNPSTDVYPVFSCGSADLDSDKARDVVKHLIAELQLRQDVTSIDRAYEATKTIYSYCYLASGVSFHKDNFKLIPEKLVEGRNGQGNLDYAIECRSTGRILGVVEVKKEDFMKGFAQASVQMESSLTGRKRKADEINDEQKIDKVFGIVTDATEWFFMECTLDEEGKPSFKLSKSVIVLYDDVDIMETRVKKVLGHIVWLLEEAQKPVGDGEQSRDIKKRKSVTNLSGKSETVDRV